MSVSMSMSVSVSVSVRVLACVCSVCSKHRDMDAKALIARPVANLIQHRQLAVGDIRRYVTVTH